MMGTSLHIASWYQMIFTLQIVIKKSSTHKMSSTHKKVKEFVSLEDIPVEKKATIDNKSH